MRYLSEVQIEAKSAARFAALLGNGGIGSLERVSAGLRTRLQERTVWNVNSTAAGGGVAEMLHSLLAYARGLNLRARWLVTGGTPDFFRITKRLHNALHGEPGDGSPLGQDEREIYEGVARDNAGELLALVSPGDVVILHDPQTAGLIPYLAERDARVIWRCHIGSDDSGVESAGGWRFLAPYLKRAHAFVFSRFAYVPEFCDPGRTVIVPPSIDPFSAKNQEMDRSTVRGILTHVGLVAGPASGDSRGFKLPDGTQALVERRAEVMREGAPPSPDTPLVVQVSRWDRLKDPVGVLRGFGRSVERNGGHGAHLMLAGPSVAEVVDDPEGADVYREVVSAWNGLPEPLRRRVHLVTLPMDDLQENAAMVNALQRHAAVVVQKSLREGFGLTVTEAMWKARPLIASAVGGIQDQVEHGVSGLLLRDPTDVEAFADSLLQLLEDAPVAERMGRNARRRVAQNYLGTRSLMQFADLIERVDHARGNGARSGRQPVTRGQRSSGL